MKNDYILAFSVLNRDFELIHKYCIVAGTLEWWQLWLSVFDPDFKLIYKNYIAAGNVEWFHLHILYVGHWLWVNFISIMSLQGMANDFNWTFYAFDPYFELIYKYCFVAGKE